MSNKSTSRIGILDGFRALAIIAVMLYHYFSLYMTGFAKTYVYPYDQKYNYFSYGYLGVEFFFIISGFVIFFTLEKTSNFSDFWKKRLIRLWPSIIIASLFIFIFFKVFDQAVINQDPQKISNFLPSLTFIRPSLLNNITDKFGFTTHFRYLNGSFWSLWVEIQFYLLVSLIYFYDKNKFLRNFLLISCVIFLINYILHSTGGSNRLHIPNAKEVSEFQFKWMDDGFNMFNFLPFFTIGVVFYQLFKNKAENKKTKISIFLFLVFFMLAEIFVAKDNWERIAFLVMYIMFYIFVYRPNLFSFFESRFFTKTGEASYFLYLIHEPIGLHLIFLFGVFFMPVGFVWPVTIMFILAVLSIYYTDFLDKKISKWLKSKFLR